MDKVHYVDDDMVQLMVQRCVEKCHFSDHSAGIFPFRLVHRHSIISVWPASASACALPALGPIQQPI
jgi:hypothetical protein